MKCLWLLGALALLCLPLSNLTAQCTLACNDQVQVSLPPEGLAVIMPDMILEGDSTDCPGPKIVEVYAPNGFNLGDTLTCDYAGQLLMASIIDVASGNYCWGAILLEDKLPPVITCPDDTVSCTADFTPGIIGPVTIFDNCDSIAEVLHVQSSSPELCTGPFTYILTRTWHATDLSGNQSSCVQTISIARPSLSDIVWPPHLDGNQAPALSCTGADTNPSNTGYPEIDGNPITAFCKINITYEDFIVDQCEGAFTILRNWLALNCCTNEILTHQQIIKVADNDPPVLTCPDTLTISANGVGCSATFLLPPIVAEDSCASTLTFFTQTPTGVIQGNGGLVIDLPFGFHTVTYQAVDGCLNTGTCQVVVEAQDNVAPIAVCDETTVVALNGQGIAEVPAETFDDGSHDLCCAMVTFLAKRMDEPSVPFTPFVTFNCDDIGDTVMVIFQVEDCFGNTNTCMVEVFVQDKLPPVINCPADITIACSDPLPPSLAQTGEPVVLEGCGIDTIFYTDVENLNVCHTGTITRTFTVVDASGFQASCTQTITTVDLTPPQFFFPPDTTVDCSVPLDEIGTDGAIALGDCELFALNISDEVFQISCGRKIVRTYTFIEWCSGFDTSGTQILIAIDTNPPVWDQPQGSLDRVFLCGSDIVKPPPPTATDFCTPWTVELVSDTSIFGSCEHDLTRLFTYTAYDTCGNVAEPFVITVVVNDTIAPTAVLPDLGPFSCYGDRPEPDTINLNASDNCINPIVINFEGDSGNPGCMGTVIRTYRLTDVCGNDTLVTQNILIQDTIPPTANLDPVGPFACLGDIPPGNATQILGETDNCGGAVTVVHMPPDIGAPLCDGQVIRTYRLIDKCGNDTLVQLPFLVNDTIPPSLNCPDTINANNSTNTCYAIVGILVGAVDNCMGNPVTITNNYNDEGEMVNDTFPLGSTSIVFYAEDACGNVDSCTVTVIVNDIIKPTNNCETFDWNLDSLGFAVIDIDSLVMLNFVGGEDLCSEVTYTIDPDSLSCADYIAEPTSVTYIFTVTDAAGNSSFCSNDILLHDPLDVCEDDPLIVNGRVFTKDHLPMPGVEMQLWDNLAMSSSLTGTNGLFSFGNLPDGMSCTLQPYKNNDLLNGVTTYDLLLVTRHILGIQEFNSPYQFIAADVNKSGTVTTFDVVNLRKAILHISDEFPGNTSWRFLRSNNGFPNAADPFGQPLPESIWLSDLSFDAVGQNFIGIKIGDINGNAVVNYSGEIEERVGEELILFTADANLQPGTSVSIPVFADAVENLAAMQLTIRYDHSLLEFENMASASLQLKEFNFAAPRAGHLTMSWDAASGQHVDPSTPLFYLQYRVLAPTAVSRAIDINSMITPAIAYKNGGDPLNILWRIRADAHTPVDAAYFFSLAQNRPNPFSGKTSIGFMLQQKMPVKLEASDVTGRGWVLYEGVLEAGWHEVPLSGETFDQPGIYFYKLTTPFGQEQRKMVKQ